jgi:hypothetical protein
VQSMAHKASQLILNLTSSDKRHDDFFQRSTFDYNGQSVQCNGGDSRLLSADTSATRDSLWKPLLSERS